MSIKSSQKEKADRIYFRILKDLERGDISTAQMQLKRLIKVEDDTPRINDLHGLFAFYGAKYGEAENYYKKAIAADPEKKEYKLNLGNLYVAMGKWKEAGELLKEIVEKDPIYFPALNNLAMCLIRTNDNDGALAIIEKMKKIKSNFPGIYRMEAIAYYDMEEFEKALAAADKNIVLDGNNPETFIILGEIFNHMERYSDAVLAFEKAVGLDPKVVDNMVSLALAYGNIRRFDKAQPVFLRVIERDPDNTTALQGLHLIYKLKGNVEKSDEYKKRADESLKKMDG